CHPSIIYPLSLHDALPILPMSRIAGAMSGIWAGFFHNYAFRHDKSIRLKTGADQVKSKFVNGFEQIINASNNNIDNELKRMLSRSEEHTSELQSREKLVCR